MRAMSSSESQDICNGYQQKLGDSVIFMLAL